MSTWTLAIFLIVLSYLLRKHLCLAISLIVLFYSIRRHFSRAMSNIGVLDQYGDLVESKGKGSRIPKKTDPDFKYRVVIATIMRLKSPSRPITGPLPRDHALSVKPEKDAIWEGGVLRGTPLKAAPAKPYTCPQSCKICFDQFYPAY